MDKLFFILLYCISFPFTTQPKLEIKISGDINKDKVVKLLVVNKSDKKENNKYSIKSCIACVKKRNESKGSCYVVSSNILDAQEFRDTMLTKLKKGDYIIVFKDILCDLSKSNTAHVFKLDDFEMNITKE